MAAVLARTCLSTLCCLALPAVAQDASIRFGEQTTRTEQTTRSSNTQTRNSGVSASGDIGAMATQSTTRYSSQSEMRSKSKAVDVDVGAGLHDRDDDRGHDRRRSRDVRDSDLFGRWARRMAAPEPSNCATANGSVAIAPMCPPGARTAFSLPIAGCCPVISCF